MGCSINLTVIHKNLSVTHAYATNTAKLEAGVGLKMQLYLRNTVSPLSGVSFCWEQK